jgi:hypothetical protein
MFSKVVMKQPTQTLLIVNYFGSSILIINSIFHNQLSSENKPAINELTTHALSNTSEN